MMRFVDQFARVGLRVVFAAGLALAAGESGAVDFREYPSLSRLVKTMVKEDGYSEAELDAILRRAKIDEGVLVSIDNQHEDKPWYRYRELFITEGRIRHGVAYWRKHHDTLERAAQVYGVPPSIIVALLGVETHFGTRKGRKRVLDSLVTLTARYPRRANFFGKQLRAFLNLTRAEGMAPEKMVGSFAGAMGIPQFMPSSYIAYAVDFNGDARRNLFEVDADAIGSVANYLKRHGWATGEAIVTPVLGKLPKEALSLVTTRAKPKWTVGHLQKKGVKFAARGGKGKAAVLRLQEPEHVRYVVGFKNFYVITRYNTSVNYAMVVVELANLIKLQRER